MQGSLMRCISTASQFNHKKLVILLVSVVLLHGPKADPAAGSVSFPCPLKNCGGATSGSPGSTVQFAPARFMCMSCDVTTCPGCAILCDASSCQGAMQPQRKTAGNKACEPWWWCGRPPPGDSIGVSAGVSFISSGHSFLRGLRKLQGGRSRRVRAARLDATANSKIADGVANVAASLSQLKLKPGRFECSSAAIPLERMNPMTMQQKHADYIAFEAKSCKGSTFETICFCYDKFRYLARQDPLTSEFFCDQSCAQGPCDGQTCGAKPPEPFDPSSGPAVPSLEDLDILNPLTLPPNEQEMVPVAEAIVEPVTAPPV
eukprot:TRINITY_DN22771_c0_g2_i1.p1 TRINITY_DN22771_c0_g2~~TRINITY_DN22771_c0_g2_i1.p1  ORF type:complete len:327 (-),score=37.26 TRINITY_DN22771_c0_g2_i1:32-982(-)